MKAVTYQGKNSISVKQVDTPTIHDKEDVIVKITSTAICGSDLHLYKWGPTNKKQKTYAKQIST